MQVQKINNTNFQGFKFKDMYAEKIFEDKLNDQPEKLRKVISDYIQNSEKEPVTVMINATKFKSHIKEHLLLATFSNNKEFIVEKSRTPKADRFKEFMDRCASMAGYKPIPNSENTANKTLNSVNITA